MSFQEHPLIQEWRADVQEQIYGIIPANIERISKKVATFASPTDMRRINMQLTDMGVSINGINDRLALKVPLSMDDVNRINSQLVAMGVSMKKMVEDVSAFGRNESQIWSKIEVAKINRESLQGQIMLGFEHRKELEAKIKSLEHPPIAGESMDWIKDWFKGITGNWIIPVAVVGTLGYLLIRKR